MLVYGGKFDRAGILDMTRREREWTLDRLDKQKQAEEEAIEKARQDAKNKANRR